MNSPTESDDERWRAVKSWLNADEQGRRILAELVSNPQVGAVALRRRMRDSSAGVTNTFTDTDIEKFVTLAHADHVYLGDQTINVDQSYNVDLDLNPMNRLRGFPRFLMIAGTLVALGGFSYILYGMYLTFTNFVGFANLPPGQMPSGMGFAPEIFIGFGVFFGGIVLVILANLFRTKDRRPRPNR
jgi:hypothetical protein